MIPFYKVISLVVRVLTKPMLSYTKKYHLGRHEYDHKYIRRIFIYLGQKYHNFEQKINKKILNISAPDDFFSKAIKDEVALEKGIEIFYEVLMYAILIILPILEIIRTTREASRKSKSLEKRLEDIENGLENCKEENKKLVEENQEIAKEMKGVKEGMERQLEVLNILQRFSIDANKLIVAFEKSGEKDGENREEGRDNDNDK